MTFVDFLRAYKDYREKGSTDYIDMIRKFFFSKITKKCRTKILVSIYDKFGQYKSELMSMSTIVEYSKKYFIVPEIVAGNWAAKSSVGNYYI